MAAQIGEPLPRPQPGEPEPSEALSEHLERVRAAEERLTAGVPADPSERTAEQHAKWLLAQLLSWQRREEKASWWRFFHLRDKLTDQERIEEPEPIGGLEYVAADREVRLQTASAGVLAVRAAFGQQASSVKRDGKSVRNLLAGSLDAMALLSVSDRRFD